MCNLYSITKGQAAIIALVRAMRDSSVGCATGNLILAGCVFWMSVGITVMRKMITTLNAMVRDDVAWADRLIFE